MRGSPHARGPPRGAGGVDSPIPPSRRGPATAGHARCPAPPPKHTTDWRVRVFGKYAHAAGVPMVEFMHMNAEGLKRRNPQIFDADAPAVEA